MGDDVAIRHNQGGAVAMKDAREGLHVSTAYGLARPAEALVRGLALRPAMIDSFSRPRGGRDPLIGRLAHGWGLSENFHVRWPAPELRATPVRWLPIVLAVLLALDRTNGLRAAEPAPAASMPSPADLPAVQARRALREFDRFLDHHPLLEDELRLDPRLLTKPAYLEANPALREFLVANREVVPAVKRWPRYYLHRALLRQANAPLARPDLLPLDGLFDRHPAIEQQLARAPAAIRDVNFLRANPPLNEFLGQHPTLARVFPPAVSLKKGTP